MQLYIDDTGDVSPNHQSDYFGFCDYFFSVNVFFQNNCSLYGNRFKYRTLFFVCLTVVVWNRYVIDLLD